MPPDYDSGGGLTTFVLHSISANYHFVLKKSDELYSDDDGTLSDLGVDVATAYARSLIAGVRDLDVERKYPQSADLFEALRADRDFRLRFAGE